MSSATEFQRALAERLRAALAADPRIESAWLSGSFGRGDGDPWSDIDVMAVVGEDERAAVVADYSRRRNPVGEAVLMFTLSDRIVCAVRPDWERYDIHFVTPQEFKAYRHWQLLPLAPESLDSAPSAGPVGRTPLHGDAVRAQVDEFFRILGLLPAALGREEWLSAQDGVGYMRRDLIEMMIASNGFGRSDRGGAKRLNAYLSDEQRAALESLPLPAPRREALIAANRALAALFLPLAKSMLAEAGAAWPQALEDATRSHLERTLGSGVWP